MGKIAEITVPSAGQATIDFTAIEQTYKHLVVTLTARADGAYPDTDIFLTFNGDTGANYDDQYLYSTGGAGGNTSALAAAHIRAGLTAGANAPAGVYAETTIEVLNYANTTPRKNVSAKTYDHGSDGGAGFMIEEAGQWRNTAAINRLTLTPSGGNFAAGTVAELWGVGGPLGGGGLATATATKTASYAMTANDGTIFVGAASLTITFPTPVGVAGRQYLVKNNGAGSGTTLATAAGTIDGAATQALTAPYAALLVESDGSNWLVVAKV